ncbi:MAG: hypothetical protein IKQ06_01055 [Bacilli bacterium]|nr:hypothetical protein [Bacilli bacterium]
MEKGKKVIGVIVLLLMVLSITIGYSYLSANLTITGTSKIKTSSWDVHFNNIQTTSGSVTPTTAPAIAANGLSITYSIELENPGDFYEFTVDVVNGGTVDAKLSALPTLSGVSTAQDVYTNFTFKHADGTAITTLANENLAAGTTKSYKVRVEFDSNVTAAQLPTANQNMTLVVSMAYEQA